MILSDTAIRRPVFTTMMIMAIVVFGIVGLQRLGTDLFPRVELPFVTVTSTLPGADPETIESMVSDPIEEAVSSINGVKSLRSVSTDAVSQVIIEFVLDKNVDIAFQEVTAKVAGVKRDLPRDLEEPVIEKLDPDSTPLLALVVSGDKPIRELTHIASKRIKTRLQSVSGVGQVQVVGGRDRTMWIWLDRQRLEGRGLAVADVVAAIHGEHAELPGGRVETGPNEYTVKTKAECATSAEFAALVVAFRNGAAVRLEDVCTRIEDGLEEERSLSQLDDHRAVSLVIRRQSGTNTLDVAYAVDRAVADMASELASEGLHLEKAQELAPFIEHSLHEIQFHLAFGGLLAVAIVFLFLRNWRTTFISALAIPTSVVGAFIFIHAFGFTLNTMTMLALSLSIGILIDDAIVVIENIYRHYEDGMAPAAAATFGTGEIGLAAFAITLSIVAVFVPVAFMGGIVGRFFYQFGITVAAAVLISLFVAFTLTPMLTARMLTHHGAGGWFYRLVEGPLELLERGYARLLRGALHLRLLTLAIAILALAGAILVGLQLSGEFIPTEDQSEFSVKLKAPLGSSLGTTGHWLDQVRERLRTQPWVVYTFTTIGSGALKRVNEGEMYVKMTPKAARSLSQLEAMAWTRERCADIARQDGMRLSVQIVARMSGGPENVDLQMDLRGPDLPGLAASAGKVMERMRAAGGYTDLSLSYEAGKPEVHVLVKRDRAADLGVSAAAIGAAIKTLVGGDEVAKFKAEGERYDVRVRLDEPLRRDPRDILDLTVRSQHGSLVRLANLVEVQPRSGPVQIDRYNRQRQVTISTNLVKTARNADQRTLVLGPAKEELKRFAAETGLPAGCRAAVIGMAEIMEESNRYLGFSLLLAVVMVYMVLASQFESFIHPFTIMLSLPLSLVGALGLLWATGAVMSIYTSIGIIMLMGLVTKNAILLVDYTNTLRQRDGLDRHAALMKAGPIRLRPILMTTLAMIAGMLPIALGRGEGAESRSPMAITVIGGLITSTLLTLVVVPVVYSLLDDLTRFILGLLAGRHPPPAASGPSSPIPPSGVTS